MNLQKTKPWRSPKYLKWIRQQDCINHPGRPAEPHHLIGVGSMGGIGTKAPDSMTIPFCRECHSEMHNNSELWPLQWQMIARTLQRAIDDGVLK